MCYPTGALQFTYTLKQQKDWLNIRTNDISPWYPALFTHKKKWIQQAANHEGKQMSDMSRGVLS